MAQRVVEIDGIGPVTIAKRRGTRNIRISINAKGRVRVGMPAWLPYQAGIEFARSHRRWIKERLAEKPSRLLYDGLQIGKAHRLRFVAGSSRLSTSIRQNVIEIHTNLPIDSPEIQASALKAAERALKAEASELLPRRLADLAAKHGFKYKEVRVRKLTSRWGSCSSHQVITLSYLLIQLPWHLIDYVLVHELVHTKHMNHSPAFWRAFEETLPAAKQLRKEMRKLQPGLLVI